MVAPLRVSERPGEHDVRPGHLAQPFEGARHSRRSSEEGHLAAALARREVDEERDRPAIAQNPHRFTRAATGRVGVHAEGRTFGAEPAEERPGLGQRSDGVHRMAAGGERGGHQLPIAEMDGRDEHPTGPVCFPEALAVDADVGQQSSRAGELDDATSEVRPAVTNRRRVGQHRELPAHRPAVAAEDGPDAAGKPRAEREGEA